MLGKINVVFSSEA